MLTLVFADASVGALYLWSADSIRKGTANGLEAALGEYFSSPGLLCTSPNPIRLPLGASALLLLSSLPRASKGPVPAVLTATSAASAYYYGKTVYALRA